MEYEKKYKEAQKWIESIYPEFSHEQQMEAEAFFPKLKESEDVDKKIREEIIATIHLYYGKPLEDEAKEMIAWLEKQGEPTDNDMKESLRIEYARTDAFIEKACNFIDERLNFDDNAWYIEGEVTVKDKVIEDFKNYMKGE